MTILNKQLKKLQCIQKAECRFVFSRFCKSNDIIELKWLPSSAELLTCYKALHSEYLPFTCQYLLKCTQDHYVKR